MRNSELAQIYQTCLSLKGTSKRLEKEEILREHKTESLIVFLRFLFDSNIVTNVKSARLRRANGCIYFDNSSLSEILDCAAQCTGTDAEILKLKSWAASVAENDEEVQFIYETFSKTLKLGITAQTVNKVYGNIIRKFDVQLSKSIDNTNIPEGAWFSISQKINGNRCLIYRGKPYSRQGKEWNGLYHIIKALETVVDLDKYAIDGELIYLNPEHLNDNDAFLKGTGILNGNGDKSYIAYTIFDILPNDEFDKGESVATYKQRKSLLKELDKRIEQEELYNVIWVVRFFYEGTDQSEIKSCLDLATNLGMEGIMINLDTPYKCKRHAGIIKAKKFYTMDLPVVAVNAGTGRLAHTLGSVDVALPVGDKTGIVSVGSGFSDEDRDVFWNNRQLLIGKIIEVKFKNITKDKDTGLPSLQFPIFIRFRDDKSEVSID